jgi:hypothetical protein
MIKDNSTGKNKDFYELGKKMFDRIKPLTPNKPPPPPPQRQWVGLTDGEVDQFHNWKDGAWSTNDLVRHIEATLKAKNT